MADFECPNDGCKAKFKQRKNLNRHMSNSCEFREASDKSGKFICPKCGIAMKRKDNLNRHMKDSKNCVKISEQRRIEEEEKENNAKRIKLSDVSKIFFSFCGVFLYCCISRVPVIRTS